MTSADLTRNKQLLTKYYISIWNANYTNSEKAAHIKLLIPNIQHRPNSSQTIAYLLSTENKENVFAKLHCKAFTDDPASDDKMLLVLEENTSCSKTLFHYHWF